MGPSYETASAFSSLVKGLIFAVIGTGNLYLLARLSGQPFNDYHQTLAAVAFILQFVIFHRYSLVWRWRIGRPGSIGTRLFTSWALLGGGLILVGFLTRQTEHFKRSVILGWLLSTPLLFALAHLVIRHLLLGYLPQVLRSRSAVIVFINPWSQRLAEIFRQLDTPQFELFGFFEDREQQRTGVPQAGAPILGSSGWLADYVKKHRVEVVFVVLPIEGKDRALEIVERLDDTTASIYYVPDLETFDLAHMRFSEVAGVPVVTLTETPFFGADGVLKRFTDFVSAGFLLLCVAPLFAVVAVLIRQTMGHPVFFTQSRYGLNGQQINIHKFRTMHVSDDDAAVAHASRDDPRVTPLGRFLRRTSIDEWPQFWNVLKGEMSLVGPRPHAVTHNEQYRQLVKRYMVRHKVKPGLTGWAQVHGLRGDIRNLDDMERRVQYDLDYIHRWSLGLDIRIILQTLWIIFRDRNAY